MREILFRGKRTDGNGWAHGVSFQYIRDDGGERAVIIQQFAPLSKTVDCVQVYPETVGQYTGLTDKNGKRIYEGDIISTDLNRPYLVVVFRGGCFEVECDDGDGIYYDIFFATCDEEQSQDKYGEVIGNIHDNADLLK